MIALIEVAGERTGLLTQLAVLASSTPVNPFDCDNRNLASKLPNFVWVLPKIFGLLLYVIPGEFATKAKVV